MQGKPARGFSLLTAMAVVAAAAPGLALTRGAPHYIGLSEHINMNWGIEVNYSAGWSLDSPGRTFTTVGTPLTNRLSYWLSHIPFWTAPCFVSWSLAVFALGLRPPRHVSGPGLAAGFAVAIALALALFRCAYYAAITGNPFKVTYQYPEAFICYFWISLPRLAGYTVGIWWLALALSGRWSLNSSATERMGQSLGWYWIAMAASSELGLWCFALNY